MKKLGSRQGLSKRENTDSVEWKCLEKLTCFFLYLWNSYVIKGFVARKKMIQLKQDNRMIMNAKEKKQYSLSFSLVLSVWRGI